MKALLGSGVVLALAGAANAGIVGVALGSGPRSSGMKVGPYLWFLLPADPSPIFSDVTSAPGSPGLTGPVGFSYPLSHRKIGQGWATWSSPWTPGWDTSVYYTGGASGVTITLPAGTMGFAFWAEPNDSGTHEIIATAQDGTTVSQQVHGLAGASGYAFYGLAGSLVTSITLTAPPAAGGFAIGEFYWATPEPASVALLGIGLLALRRR